MLYFLLALSLLLLIAITATAAYFVFQKRDADPYPTIHTSGAFSIVRQSPRESLAKRRLEAGDIKEVLGKSKEPDSEKKAQLYLELWDEILDDSIRVIEEGDSQGSQTFSFHTQKGDLPFCLTLSETSYVSREQLRNFPQLIPPFHLGCKMRLVAKPAWNTNLDGTGWQPLLPVKGKYELPDWRTLVEI